MRAFVTGIPGFAGNYLTQLLLAKGVEVYGASQEAAFKPFLDLDADAVHYSQADIRDESELTRLIGAAQPDLIFHLAARTSPAQSVKHPRETFDINFQGTLSLFEAVRRLALRSRILVVSSSHVYGNSTSPRRIPEDAPLRPCTPYAASKVAAEMLAYQYWQAYGIETVRVRAFNHTGPGQQEGFVCPDLARQVAEIECGLRPPRLEVGDLNVWRDFSDVRDIVAGYHSALVNGASGEVYNLCSGQRLTVEAVVGRLVSSASRPIDVVAAPSRSGEKEMGGLVGDNSRAQHELNWKPSIPFERTLRELQHFWRRRVAAANQVETEDNRVRGS